MIDFDKLPVGALVAAAVLVLAAVMMPVVPVDNHATEAKSGTVQTPQPDAPTAPENPDERLYAVPETHTETATAGVDPPNVSSSTGSQTMRVSVRESGGQPQLVLEDDDTHAGRWVSVPTAWVETHAGAVPNVVTVAHESGDEYAAPLHVRDSSAVFYVREFSTNTVTFSGEVSISATPATDGSSWSYDLNSTDSVSDFTINVTGRQATESETETPTILGGESQSISFASSTADTASIDVTAVPETRSIGSYTLDNGQSTNMSADVSNMAHLQDLEVDVEDTGSELGSSVNITVKAPDGTVIDNPDGVGAGSSASSYTRTVDTDVSAYSTVYIVFDFDGGTSGETTTASDVRIVSDGSTDGLTLSADGGGGSFNAGTLSNGGTASGTIDLTTSTTTITASGDGAVDVTLDYTETAEPIDPTLTINGQTTGYTGQLNDGETVSLSTDTAWITTGTNDVSLSLDQTPSGADAPAAEVDIAYSHDATDEKTIEYTSGQWRESYNVSKTFASDQSNATHTIPFSNNVVSIKSVEMQTNGGSWTSPPSYSLDGNTMTVQLGDVTSGDTVAVRTTGSRVQVINGSITVQQTTAPGSRLNSSIQLDSWANDSYIAVAGSTSGDRIHYSTGESWSNPDEFAEVTAEGNNRLYLPNAADGSTFEVSTVPLRVNVITGDVRLKMVTPSTTEPEFEVITGSSTGDNVEYTFLNATSGTEYNLYSVTNGIIRDSGTASSPVTLSDDDSEETLIIRAGGGGSSSSGGGGGGAGIVSTPSSNDVPWIPLIAVSLALAGLVVVSRNDDAVTNAGAGAAEGVEGALSGVPVVGPAAGKVSAGLIQSGSQFAQAALGNRTISLALIAGVAWGAIQAGIIALPAGSQTIIVVGVVAIGSLVALREFGEFSRVRWVGIVVSATVIAVQTLSDESLLTAIVNSQVWPLLAVGALYLGYKGVQSLQQPDQVNRIVISDESDEEDDNK